MKYKDIKDFNQRCEEHKDHQTGMISTGMLACRMQEEIDELRAYIEQSTWVGLTDDERKTISEANNMLADDDLFDEIEDKLKEKNQ